MADDLKTRILTNRFVDRLRTELQIDDREFEDLCEALKELAAKWRGVSLIDKELMQDLYALASITNNVAAVFDPDRPEVAHLIREMATQIDALVLECLADP